MKSYDAPPVFMRKPVGSMLIQPSKDGLQLFIRETHANLSRYPRPFTVEVRLPTWDMPPVVVAALLAHIRHGDHVAFMTWINCGSLPGVQILTKLSSAPDIYVRFVTDHTEQTVRVRNTLKRPATELLERVSSRQGKWNLEALEEAQHRIYRLYPTTWLLWRTMKMDRRG
jgi:hypothetical protein